MTNEEINIEIAEEFGWRIFQSGDSVWAMPPECELPESADKDCPDYCNDLNVMHEVEKVLEAFGNWDGNGNSQLDCYLARISKRATARQRAEAFLRTLGKWKE